MRVIQCFIRFLNSRPQGELTPYNRPYQPLPRQCGSLSYHGNLSGTRVEATLEWRKYQEVGVVSNPILRGGFIFFYFHPYLGKIPILTNIFQRDWFNHQLEIPLGRILPGLLGIGTHISHTHRRVGQVTPFVGWFSKGIRAPKWPKTFRLKDFFDWTNGIGYHLYQKWAVISSPQSFRFILRMILPSYIGIMIRTSHGTNSIPKCSMGVA